jgi:hypothetical protein
MHSKTAIKIVDINGQKIVLNTLYEVYKTKRTQKDRSEFERNIGKNLVAGFKRDINNLVKKLLSLKSFNSATYDKYFSILTEATDAFILGNYQATIACCGIASEIITLDIVLKNKPASVAKGTFDHMSQQSKLILLLMTKQIKQSTYHKLDEIRNIRNKYIHQTASLQDHEEDAKTCFNHLIEIIKVTYKPV